MNVVAYNLMAANASRQLNIVTKDKQKKTEKLSSGYRINRAADDAAGLAISEKMRWQVRGLDRSAANIQDGVSYCNVAEGALQEIHSMLDRMKELSVQAANDTNTANDRQQIDGEVQQLTQEMDHVFRDTEFNTRKIWRGAYIPEPSGTAEDFHLYNNNRIAGGIVYGNHRYSWTDMGISVDSAGHFTSDFSVDSSSFLKNDGTSAKDDDFASASFTLSGKKGASVDTLQKSYSWKATDDGISIDGVAAKNRGTDGGDTTWTGMGITPGKDVSAGQYSFTYYGQTVSFEVEEDAVWDDFLTNINDPSVKIDWHSTVNGRESAQSANVTLHPGTIKIDPSNKNSIIQTGGYDVTADHDKVGIVYNDGPKTTDWSALSVNPDGTSLNAWGDHTGESDKATVDKDSLYTYNDGIISFDLKLNQNGSEQSITDDLKNTRINATTSAPTTIKLGTSTASGIAANAKVSLTGASGSVSFEDQRDKFGRTFDYPNEVIATGQINKAAAGTGYSYSVTLAAGSGSITLTTSSNMKAEIGQAIKQAIKDQRNVQSVNFGFAGGNNSFNLEYDLTGITYQDISSMNDTEIDNLADAIINGNNALTLNADGDAVQTLSVSNASRSESDATHSTKVDGFKEHLMIQAGALAFQGIAIDYDYLRASNLGLGGVNVLTYDSAQSAIAAVDGAIDIVSEQRALFGAYTNRLEHAYNANLNTSENTSAAESRIRDADMSKEMVGYSRDNILQQVGQSVLAQANQQPQGILTLLQ